MSLSEKPKERVLIALNLVTGDFAIEECYVDPPFTGTESHLMADECVRITSVLPTEKCIEFASYIAISHP